MAKNHPPTLPPEVKAKIKEKREKTLKQRAEQEAALARLTKKGDFLQQLPFELLNEVLVRCSPITILAVARSCKWLCHTLTHPDHAFVWKQARNRPMPYRIPDPPEYLTESAYASLLFDGGRCAGCSRNVQDPPAYFYPKIWMCRGAGCAASISKLFVPLVPHATAAVLGHDDTIKDVLMKSLYKSGVHLVDTVFYANVLKSERDAALQEWEDAGGDEASQSKILTKWKEKSIMLLQVEEHELLYGRWRGKWMNKRDDAAADSWTFAGAKAAVNGWDNQDLSGSSTYKVLYKTAIREGESILDSAWERNSAKIAEEVKTSENLRKERLKAYNRGVRRTAVETFWKESLSKRKFVGQLPTLKAFRSFPTIHNLERNESITELTKMLKEDKSLVDMIKLDLEAWTKMTKANLMVKLGFKKKWSPPSDQPDMIYPLDRLTALFECTRCHRNGRKFSESSSMTYVGVIKHRCPKGTVVKDEHGKAISRSREWDLQNFVKDEVACSVLQLALQLSGRREETTNPATMYAPEANWQCLSCPSKITLRFNDLVGHAKRHKAQASRAAQPPTEDQMAIDPAPFSFSLAYLLPNDAPSNVGPPYDDMEALMSDTGYAEARRKQKVFRCRHCEVVASQQSTAKGGSSVPRQRCFDISGLQSHVLAKHGVAPLRSEDFYKAWRDLEEPESIPSKLAEKTIEEAVQSVSEDSDLSSEGEE